MMWTREELKTKAKELLKGNYWKTVLVSLILVFVNGGGSAASSSSNTDRNELSDMFSNLSSGEIAAVLAIIFGIVAVAGLIGLVLKVFVYNPIDVGCRRFMILTGKEATSLKDVVFVFKNSYLNVVKIMFLRDLFICLWTLLLVIPGIVKTYEYYMIPYLLAEKPDMSKAEAFEATKKMMTGDKWNTFVLNLSFIGWNLLGVITCGLLLVFYVNPYQFLTGAQLYDTLKAKLN